METFAPIKNANNLFVCEAVASLDPNEVQGLKSFCKMHGRDRSCGVCIDGYGHDLLGNCVEASTDPSDGHDIEFCLLMEKNLDGAWKCSLCFKALPGEQGGRRRCLPSEVIKPSNCRYSVVNALVEAFNYAVCKSCADGF